VNTSTGCRDKETESQQPRVSHPSEAGRRTKEPGGKQKVNNKESVTLEPGTPGRKQKVNNKESVTLEEESRNPRENRKSTTKSQSSA